MAAPLYC